MSRLGKKPINVPEETKIKLDSDSIRVEGKKGSLSLIIPAGITVVRDGDYLKVSRANNLRHNRAMHGTIRQLIANMITGVNKEWQKKLEIIGTGYEVQLKGENLIFSLGFSHKIELAPLEGVRFEVEGNNFITVAAIDKQKVGEMAYQIRSLRPPDVYKGKGIRYLGEEIKLKPGKAAKMGEAGEGAA